MKKQIETLEKNLAESEKLASEIIAALPKSGVAISLRGRINDSRDMLEALKLEVEAKAATKNPVP